MSGGGGKRGYIIKRREKKTMKKYISRGFIMYATFDNRGEVLSFP